MKHIKIVLLLAGLLLLVSGCEKKPLNSDLERHWRLEQFTLLESNEVVECKQLFYGITYMVTEVAEKDGVHKYNDFVARTEYSEDGSLLILRDFKEQRYNTDNGVSATPEQLKPFGIINPKETVFQILELTHSRLVLESDYARLELSVF